MFANTFVKRHHFTKETNCFNLQTTQQAKETINICINNNKHKIQQ